MNLILLLTDTLVIPHLTRMRERTGPSNNIGTQCGRTARNMAGVLFEDIFNVKDIDPEGKKFDRGESISEFIFRRVRVSTCRSNARAIFIARTIASHELLDLADSAGTTSTWYTSFYTFFCYWHLPTKVNTARVL